MPAILFSLQYWVYGIPRCQLLRLQDSAMLVVLSNLRNVCKASTVCNSSHILSACLRADSYAGSMLLLCCFLQRHWRAEASPGLSTACQASDMCSCPQEQTP